MPVASPSAAVRLELEVLGQNGAVARSVTLDHGVHTLGRGEENSATLLYASISRQHALLYFENETLAVEDLDSKNGTFIDDQRVSGRTPLEQGQTLRLGDVRLRVRRVQDDAVAPLPIGAHEPVLTSGNFELAPAPLETWFGDTTRAPRLTGQHSIVAARSAEEKLRVLLSVAESFGKAMQRATLHERVVDLAVQLLEADRGALLLAVDAPDVLVPAFVRSDGETRASELGWSRAVVGWVQTHQRGGLFSDMLLDQRLHASESTILRRAAAALAAPLFAGDRFMGVLYVDHRTARGVYTEADLEMLCAIANQAAVAIDRMALRERVESEAVLRNGLMRFFPPNAVGRFDTRAGFSLEPKDTTVTALFADISGYTDLSERLAPRALVALLNRYFPVVSEIVFRHDGTLEKYIGDALLAVWGAPFTRPDDAQRALSAAIEMQRAVQALAPTLPATLQIHIGVHTGPVCAANIGSERYLQFATIGDATNLASRVCGLAQAGEILMTEDTRAQVKADLSLEDRGTTLVKGRTQPVRLWRVHT